MNLLVLPNLGRSYNSVRPEATIYIDLAKRGHQITIMTNDDDAYLQEYVNSGLKVLNISSKKKLSLSAIKTINRYIKSSNIDIVYATTSRTIPNAVWGVMATKAKIIAYRGTTGGLYRTDLSNYLSVLNPRVDGFICVSKAVEKHVKAQVLGNQITRMIYKGHDIEWYQEPAVCLESLGSSPSFFNLMCVGSIRPHKGTFVVLDALATIKHLTNIKLILVGENLNSVEFDQYITKRGIEHMVIRTGFRADVPAVAKSCDVTILPSKREGLPRVVLESLAVGTPVISTDNEGTLEIIEAQENGLIFPVGDSQALANCIETVYKDSELLERLTTNAQTAIRTKFSHQATVEQYEQFFEEMMSKKT
ncbi:glycosyltransferase family 4 protein [Thalassotalea eurytherma]|uniref:Glycosyltransferase family 1 protein n=1 Tax=Thalassotalea eurytherma TaxID=1144278 RepID=A0ABQ6H7V0_9GAMM|nr:glycosyltransferase family 4 protein [Thalassotalea eurytherma]GLX82521.1 hypothetical protein theurythT_19730 [Thalassotalea eurytherma]